MTRWHEEQREALRQGLSEDFDGLFARAKRFDGGIRRQNLDLMNLQKVVPVRDGLRRDAAMEESFNGLNPWVHNEIRRTYERTDQRVLVHRRREAALYRCAELCRRGSAEAGKALVDFLRVFPGDADGLGLLEQCGDSLRQNIPAPLRALCRVREFRDPVHALVSATCAVGDGFWTGNRQGVVRRFDTAGVLLETHEPRTEHVENIFSDGTGRIYACDPLTRVVAVVEPGRGVVERMDLSRHLAPTRSGLTGCAGSFGVFLGAYDEGADKTTLLAVAGNVLSPVFAAPGHHQVVQTSAGVFAVEGYSRRVRRILPVEEPLFSLPSDRLARPTRVTRFDDGHLLFLGKSSLGLYSLDGREVLHTSSMRYAEGCVQLANAQRGDDTAEALYVANVNESVVHALELRA